MSYLRWKSLDVPSIVGATVTTTLAIGLLARLSLQGKTIKIYRSPRETLLPKLTEQEKNDLPYPPDVLPGGRDVDTPYGTIRIYEFGPETGRKVLLVHGISTPCLSLGALSQGLVEKGCRVMLFDLWGRGYSDAPADLDYDNRLYASQIIFAITSSELDWKTFNMIGYSLGGGISLDFASYFPQMIESLVLLAPSGLIRPQHFGGVGKFLYSSGIIPEALVQWLVKRRLQSGPISTRGKSVANEKPSVEDAVSAEAKTSPQAPQQAPASITHPNVSVIQAVQWQINANTGFVNSFMSSIRYAPITGQQATWKRVGLFLSTKTTTGKKGLESGKVLVIAGTTDVVIIPEELKEDIHQAMGGDYYQWEVIDGGHDFPSSKSVEVVRIISESWGL